MKRTRKSSGPKNQLFSRLMVLGLLLIGLLIMCYPFYIDAVNGYIDQYRIAKFEKEMTARNSETVAAQKKKMEEKNKEIAKNGLVANSDPFTDIAEDEITSNAMRKEHLIGSISIPKIKVTIPLFDTTNDFLLQDGATVLDDYSMPTGGEDTHAVIAGHRGLAQRKLFTDLDKIKLGDTFVINVLNDNLAYEVDNIQVVKPNDISALAIQPHRDLVTLVTCTPYMINSHRLLITGHRVPYTATIAKEVAKGNQGMNLQRIIILSAFVVGIVTIFGTMGYMIYRARQTTRTITIRLMVKNQAGQPLKNEQVLLYPKKGNQPLTQNGRRVIQTTDENGIIEFHYLKADIYRAKLVYHEDVEVFVGIKNKKQKTIEVYQSQAKKNQQPVAKECQISLVLPISSVFA